MPNALNTISTASNAVPSAVTAGHPRPAPNPLDQLADIHLPDPVSWWPLAPGWWMLLGLAVSIFIAVALLVAARKRNAYRRQAVAELEQIYLQLTQHQQTAQYLQQVNALLKRVALTRYRQQFNPSIKGQDWLRWLDTSCPKLPGSFAKSAEQLLVHGLYQPDPQGDFPALQQLALAWIKLHPGTLTNPPKTKTDQPAEGEAQRV